MILQTGLRTDIPAFYADWLANRLRAGFVCVRNPYNRKQVTKYRLSPDVVDLIGFCTKNPAPMFPYMDLLGPYGQYWFVTITPYGKEIEPNVPAKATVLESFRSLSGLIGTNCIAWRYDPILVSDTWTVERHIRAFEHMASALAGYTDTCVISFIDLYQKVRRNFPEVRAVRSSERIEIGKAFTGIGEKYGFSLKACAEGNDLAPYGIDCSGCMTIQTYEKALDCRLEVPRLPTYRQECDCYLAHDIGAYDTCAHQCRYCYANTDPKAVRTNRLRHNPDSPFLIGDYEPDDEIHEAKQKSWLDPQLSLFS